MVYYDNSTESVAERASKAFSTDGVRHEQKWSGGESHDAKASLLAPEQRTFAFKQRILPLGDGTFLRLRKDPIIHLDRSGMSGVVEAWNLAIQIADLHTLPRCIARKFLLHHAKALAQELTEAEQEEWLVMLEAVDYRAFCIERAQPHYVEGELLAGDRLRVEWEDGSVETLPYRLKSFLALLEPGDRFSAYAKLGHDNQVLTLSSVTPLPPA
jgi:hypothetical protein